MINDLQKIIILSVMKKSKSIQELYINMLSTFTINTLCDMMNINRNRFNYLVRQGQFKNEVLKLCNDVAIEHLKEKKGNDERT